MNFSSVEFLFYFLPAFLVVYVATGRSNVVLLAGSAVFYAWGELRNAWVLLASLLACHATGLALDRFPDRPVVRRRVMVLGVLFQLLLLAAFKYLGFLIHSLEALGLRIGLQIDDVPALPVGISFFTFHAISYLVDCYRGNTRVERSLFRLANYLLLFPHLLAGPIVRYAAIRRQLVRRHWTAARWRFGLELLVIGLAQKLLLANNLAVTVDAIYALDRNALSMGVAWLGAIGYAFQVYMDFSGYSHMALGLALLLGFSFPRNFNFPFRSLSVREFWRRWHISLATWLRDYVYLPLGGSRRGAPRTMVNTVLVFTLCGLWHGAGWTFVLWGAYNGLFIVLERLKLAEVTARWPTVVQQGYAWLVFVVGVAMFRAQDMTQAVDFYAAMAGLATTADHAPVLLRYLDGKALTVLLLAGCSMLPLREWIGGGHFVRPRFPVPRFAFLSLLLLLCAMTLAAGSHNPFLYFRF